MDNAITYPVDCVYTEEELDIIDQYKTDFENTVSEQEGLWLKEGGPTDDEWESYVAKLKETCGMEELLGVYQAAYDRYTEAEKQSNQNNIRAHLLLKSVPKRKY